jgi:hypothetical protein
MAMPLATLLVNGGTTIIGMLMFYMIVYRCGRRTQEELAFSTSCRADQRRNPLLVHKQTL